MYNQEQYSRVAQNTPEHQGCVGVSSPGGASGGKKFCTTWVVVSTQYEHKQAYTIDVTVEN